MVYIFRERSLHGRSNMISLAEERKATKIAINNKYFIKISNII